MKIKLNQSEYWDKVANEKTFSHEPDWDYLRRKINVSSAILDYGCGYGRTVQGFRDKGYPNIIGMDSSEKMIERARKSNNALNVIHNQDSKIPFEDNSFDLILLFAVLTCIPLNEDQKSLLIEIKRVLKHGGLLYVSDLLINSDLRNKKRYEENKEGEYGVFKLKEGAILRHHGIEHLEKELFKDFEIEFKKFFEVRTMNGNKSKAIQIIGKRLNS